MAVVNDPSFLFIYIGDFTICRGIYLLLSVFLDDF